MGARKWDWQRPFRNITPATAREIAGPMNIYDISLPLHAGSPCWPGKSPLTLNATRSLSRGDHCTSHTIGMDIHLGTHIDAPAHFIVDGITLDHVPLATMMGPCRVIEFLGGPGSEIPAQVMAGGHRSERVLFKTFNSQLLSQSKFDPRFVALSEGLAHLLVQDGVRLVGIDYFSVDRFNSPGSGSPSHPSRFRGPDSGGNQPCRGRTRGLSTDCSAVEHHRSRGEPGPGCSR